MEVGVKLGGGGGGGGKRVGTIGVIEEDMGDGMQCSEHPYRNKGGICAFCLQEKLGKLVSSSSPLPIHPFPSSSPGSSSPSFRSEANVGVSVNATNNGNNNNGSFGSTSSSSASKPKLGREYDQFHIKRAKIPFLLAKKKKKTSVHGGSDRASGTVVTFKRSKSTVTPGRGRFLEDEESFSPRKRNGFWSFLSLSSSSRLNGHGGSNSMKKVDKERDCTAVHEQKMVAPSNNGPVCMKTKVEILEEDSSVVAPDPDCHVGTAVPSFERKVSRSRSVGCGSRSFSGDFFERISTGFGDCTLRRVESQREGKQKVTPSSSSTVYGGAGYDPHHHHNIHHQHGQHFIKERVKCGGIFGGFMMTSSSTSSICSSSSTYNWVNPGSNSEDVVVAAKSSSVGFGGGNGSSNSNNNNNGRNPNKSSWSWAFASPMRAFSKPSSSSSSKENGKKDVNKNTAPNLDAIPSLLTVSS